MDVFQGFQWLTLSRAPIPLLASSLQASSLSSPPVPLGWFGVIMIPTLFAATSPSLLRSTLSVASEVRSGGIQLAVLRSCSSRPAECIDGWREVPNGLAFDDYLGCQGHESAGWLALTKTGSIAGRRLYSYGMSGREKTAVHRSLFARAGIRAEFVTSVALPMMGAFLAHCRTFGNLGIWS